MKQELMGWQLHQLDRKHIICTLPLMPNRVSALKAVTKNIYQLHKNQGATIRTVLILFFQKNVRTVSVRHFAVR